MKSPMSRLRPGLCISVLMTHDNFCLSSFRRHFLCLTSFLQTRLVTSVDVFSYFHAKCLADRVKPIINSLERRVVEYFVIESSLSWIVLASCRT